MKPHLTTTTGQGILDKSFTDLVTRERAEYFHGLAREQEAQTQRSFLGTSLNTGKRVTSETHYTPSMGNPLNEESGNQGNENE
tara:strand:- start:37 stop:285 length:249 start_codon:yes stop_codon:yes gene_type:complete